MIFTSHAQAQNCLAMRFIINSLEFPYLLTQCHKFPWNILNHLCLNRQKSNSILLEQKHLGIPYGHTLFPKKSILFMHRGWQGGKYETEAVLWLLNRTRRLVRGAVVGKTGKTSVLP